MSLGDRMKYRTASARLLSFVLGAASLASCGTMEPMSFERGTATPEQFRRDDYECERDARMVRGDSCTQMDMFESCMKAKGYEPIKDSGNKGLCARLL